MNNITTLFIDESGKASLVRAGNDPFILTGVLLDREEINPTEGFFKYIKRKYSINENLPFHSYDVFENPKTKKLSDLEASKLVKDLADFISLIPIKINIIGVDKEVFKKTLGVKSLEDFKGSAERKELKESPYHITSALLFKWFSSSLKKDNIGEIIVDSIRGGNYKLIKSLDSCKDSSYLDMETARLIKEKCTAICFAEKVFLSGGLEITDLISYTAFFKARKIMKTMDRMGLNKIWQQIKLKMNKKKINVLNEKVIRSFFKIKKDEVHKYLKTKSKI